MKKCGAILSLSVISALMIAGCGNGGGNGNGDGPGENLTPIADAGADQSVEEQVVVELDATNSRDDDGSIVTYAWSQVGIPAVALTGADTATASFTAPTTGQITVLVFRLTVTDDQGATHSDEVSVTVSPEGSVVFGLDDRPSNTTCLIPDPPAETAEIALERAFAALSFTQPVGLLQAPGVDDRWYVVEQAGVVRTFKAGDSAATIYADIQSKVTSGGERGLLGMAFHPDFPTTPYVYLSYTATNNGLRSVISRFTVTSGSLDTASEQVILDLAQPYGNHNGGQIGFGPDGYLYIGFGDGGSQGDPDNHGQNTHTLLGSMLRIDVDAATPYAIPSDNPFASSSGCGNGNGCPEIWAWGFRNPWRWSFDQSNGQLWASDVGQDAREEVSIVEKGNNYGWRCYEGNILYNGDGCGSAGNYTFPVAEYSHTEGCSITGGYVYRGSVIPALQGAYLYGDFCSGTVWGYFGSGTSPRVLLSTSHRISSFAQGNDGEMYLISFNQGQIHRVVNQASTTTGNGFPQKLSQTGCFDSSDPKIPASGLIPYDLNAPLWSDGTEKHRWFALPDDKAITIEADGDWNFPVGSVLAKEFSLAGKRIETRLLVRHDDGRWGAYSYEWDDQERDATLLTTGKTKQIAGQSWAYPSRAQCIECHTDAAIFALGPETPQLNRLYTYPSTGRTANQLTTYDKVGLFDAPLPEPAENLDALPVPTDAAKPLEARARAYLHENCSGCHRPGGIGNVTFDLRYQIPLAETGICDVQPEKGNLGVTNARLLAPGAPERSMISRRMHSLDTAQRMPPLGSSVVDSEGVGVIDDWIRSVSSCP